MGVQTSHCAILTSETCKCSNKIKFKTILPSKLHFYFFIKNMGCYMIDITRLLSWKNQMQINFLVLQKKPFFLLVAFQQMFSTCYAYNVSEPYKYVSVNKTKILCYSDLKTQLLPIYALLVKIQ